MSIAILSGTTDLIFLDATIQWDQTYQANVTSHAVETGVNISDHVIEQNDKFRVRGVLTDADFNHDRPPIRTGLTGTELDDEIRYKQFINYDPVQKSPLISFGPTQLANLLPASATQFLGNNTPTVTMEAQPKTFPAATAMQALKRMHKQRETVKVIEYREDGSGSYKVYDDLIITSITDNIDPDSGDAFYPDMTFERVRYANSKKVVIPHELMKVPTSQKKAKGHVSTKDKKVDRATDEKDDLSNLSPKDKQLQKAADTTARGKKEQ